MTASPRGLIVIDKPIGPTSHDVVGKLRRLFHTRRVGHAGTLDPMATGVLVALIGEATKLSTWLTLDDKRYVARVAFGRATDSLDATGKTTAEQPVPDWLVAELEAVARGDRASAPRLGAALDAEAARASQIPPAFSAIQKDGVRAHHAARKGHALTLDARDVVVRSLAVRGGSAEPPFVDVELDVGKGYYVRSFARDLGEALAIPACLSALRRTRSGPFAIEESVTLDALSSMSSDERVTGLAPLADVARRALPCATLTAEGLRKAPLGQRLAAEHFATTPHDDAPFAWLDESGGLVSIGARREEGGYAILRNLVGDD